MTPLLDLPQVRSFLAAADHGSMTAAGEILRLSQGAVSQHIARLERTLGCVLFVRGRRGLTLTDDGERLVQPARSLLAQNDRAWSALNGARVTRQVRLGVPFDLVGTLLPPAVHSFATDFPDTELSLVCESSPVLLAQLAAGSIDLAVVEVPAETGRPSGSARRLTVEPLVWVGAPGGRAHRRRPLPVSLVSDTCAFRPLVLEGLRAADVTWRMVFDQGNLDATFATVRMDLAVTAALTTCVPSGFELLATGAGPDGLPPLGSIAIDLHLSAAGAQDPGVGELARRIRTLFR
ncbi:MAG: LysR family transcriptional regulator [Nakamurella sp.]